jgi:hypothetical protein
VDPWGAPGWVLGRHLSNQESDLGTGARASRLALPPPEETKSPTMPGDDGLGPDDDQALAPPWEAVNDERPEGSVPRTQGKPCGLRPEEDPELMAKGQVLGHEGGPRTKKGAEGAESESNETEHRERIRPEDGPPRRSSDQTEVQRVEGPTARPRTPLWGFGEGQPFKSLVFRLIQ